MAAAATSRTPKERKRAPGSQASPAKASKRYRARKATSRDDDETSVTSTAPKILTKEEIQKRRAKRRQVIDSHKRRADYKAFKAAFPTNNLSQPMTPDPEEDLSKRPWEAQIHKWRKHIRTWYAANNPDAEIDDDISDYEYD